MSREQKVNVNTLDTVEVKMTQIGKKWEVRSEKTGTQNKLSIINGKSILPEVTKGISILSKVA